MPDTVPVAPIRDRATLARIVDEGTVENVYRLQVMNAAEQPQRYRIGVEGLDRIAVLGSTELTVGPAEAHWVTLSARVPFDAAQQAGAGAHTIHFRIERLPQAGDSAVTILEKSTFLIPR